MAANQLVVVTESCWRLRKALDQDQSFRPLAHFRSFSQSIPLSADWWHGYRLQPMTSCQPKRPHLMQALGTLMLSKDDILHITLFFKT